MGDSQVSTQPHHRGPICRRCGMPEATQAAWDELAEETGADLCWHEGLGCESKDWPAEVATIRAQLAETIRLANETVAAVKEQLAVVTARAERAEKLYAASLEHLGDWDRRVGELQDEVAALRAAGSATHESSGACTCPFPRTDCPECTDLNCRACSAAEGAAQKEMSR